MAVNAVREDDEIANIVLRDMHKELLLQINVDEITIHLVSAGMITSSQCETLQNDRCTASSRSVFLLSNVLGGKGYWSLKTLLAALRGNALYRPHLELASNIENEYCERLQRPSSFVQPVSRPQSYIDQQAPDPRTGESPPSTISSSSTSFSQQGYSLHFAHPGDYCVKVNVSESSRLLQNHGNCKVSMLLHTVIMLNCAVSMSAVSAEVFRHLNAVVNLGICCTCMDS